MKLFFTVFLLMLELSSLNAKAKPVQISFEDMNYKVSGEGLEVVQERFRHGKKSLKWIFLPHGKFNLIENKLQGKLKAYSFWVYSAEKINDFLTVVLDNRQSNKIGLDFVGWRRFFVKIDDKFKKSDLKSNITFIGPDQSGEIYIDLVEFNPENLSLIEGDSNIPFNNEISQFSGAWYWQNAYLKENLDRVVDPEVQLSFKLMRERYLECFASYSESKAYIGPSIPGDANAYYKSIEKQLNLKRSGDIITGTPISKKNINDLGHLFIKYAREWRLNPSLENEKRVMLLYDFYTDQGYCHNSSLGETDHGFWHLKHLGPAYVLIRPLLIKRGKLDEAVKNLIWLSLLNRIFEPLTPGSVHNPTYTSMPLMLGALMMMKDNDSKKEMYVQRYLNWNNINAIPTILTGIRNPDYTQFFHSRHSAGYYAGDFINLGKCIYVLQDKNFKIPENMIHDFKMKFYINEFTHCDVSPSPAMANRFPFSYKWGLWSRLQGLGGKWKVEQEALFTDCNYGNAHVLGLIKFDDNSQFEVQGALKRWSKSLDHKYFKKDYLDLFENKEVKKEPNGFLPLNFSQVSTFRRKNWMVSIASYNKYVPAGEFNNFATHARYLFNGSMWIQSQGKPTVNQLGSGFNIEGFDYNHVPGATAVVLDNEKLPSDNFIYSPEEFSGGVHLYGRFGVHTTYLKNNPDKSFEAKKSFFCFDDAILCLGTGITNKLSNETHTTLFQHNIKDDRYEQYINDDLFESDGVKNLDSLEQGEILLDSRKNGYYIYPDYKIILERKNFITQGTLSKKSNKESRISLAYVNHGNSPQSSDYKYIVKINSNLKEMSNFKLQMRSSKKPYTIINMDNDTHIVRDNVSNIEGYVFYTPKKLIDCFIQNINHRSIVLVHHVSEEIKYLAVGNPDQDLIEHPNKSLHEKYLPNRTEIKLTVKGLWKAGINESLPDVYQYGIPYWSIKADYHNKTTEIIYYSELGRSLNIKLVKAEFK